MELSTDAVVRSNLNDLRCTVPASHRERHDEFANVLQSRVGENCVHVRVKIVLISEGMLKMTPHVDVQTLPEQYNTLVS